MCVSVGDYVKVCVVWVYVFLCVSVCVGECGNVSASISVCMPVCVGCFCISVCVYVCLYVYVLSGYLGADDKWLSEPKHWWLMHVILSIRKAEIRSIAGGD